MSITTAKDKLGSLVDDIVSSLNDQSITVTPAQITELKRVSAVWLDNTQTKVLSLTDNKPDYHQILLQLQNMLEHEDAWRDTLTAGAGQAIMRFIAAAVAYTVYAQERSAQERHLYLARLASSIFASTRSLGVRITRTKPASTLVQLTRTGAEALIIPAFSVFSVGSTKFFNRKVISFGKGNVYPVEADLTQGDIFLDKYTSAGVPFTMYEVGNGEGKISDEDVYFYVNEEEYVRSIDDAFFTAGPNDKVFYENTLQNGNVEIITGSGNYGFLPPANSAIKIRYATTSGAEAETSLVELPVLCPDFSTVSGKSLTPITGSIAPRSMEFYRVNAPYMRAADKRTVIRRDYELRAIKYDTLPVFDARAIGQQEIAPTKKWAMGVFKVCALTTNPMDDAQWRDFAIYMQKTGMEGFTILREDPVKVVIPVQMRIGINPSYALESARLAAIASLRTAYAPQQGSLGKTFYRHDLSTILQRSKDPALKDAIDWIEIDLPVDQSIALAWNQYIVLAENLVVTTEYSERNYSNGIGTTT